SFLAFSKASVPHGYHSVGLWACMSRYGLVSLAKRFVNFGFSLVFWASAGWDAMLRATMTSGSQGSFFMRVLNFTRIALIVLWPVSGKSAGWQSDDGGPRPGRHVRRALTRMLIFSILL